MNAPTERYRECAACGHYPEYHDQPGQACRAWDPDRTDWTCACKGWQEPPPPKPAPAAAPEAYEPPIEENAP